MKRQFKDEDIIRFLFDEMNQAESEQFLTAMCADEALWDRYEYFQETVEEISTLSYEPSEYSCQQVLKYVRETSEVPEPTPVADISPAPGPHKRSLADWLPFGINPNAVMAVALGLFLCIGAMSIAYKVQRGAIANPNTINVVQQVPLMEDDARYEWDDSDIQDKLDHVRDGIENLKDGPIL